MLLLTNHDNLDEVSFTVTDIKIIGSFLFISDIKYGIFVIKFGIYPGDVTSRFLYPLTSSPNKLYVDAHDNYQFQLLVSTLENNEIIVFERIEAE
jgi:hypothetical protein